MDLIWLCFVSVRYISEGLLGVLMRWCMSNIMLGIPLVLNVMALING
jgi:hypothetical protein